MSTSPSARPAAVVAEAWASARSRPTPTVTTAAVIALVCLAIIATTGRTVATERQVLSSVDAMGTRLITVTDATGSADIAPSALEVIADMGAVDWVFGLGPARDVSRGDLAGTATGQPVAVRALLGDLPPEIARTTGRAASEGEALAGSEALRRLGLPHPSGQIWTQGRPLAVVGAFVATGPLSSLNETVLYRDPDVGTVRYLYVAVRVGHDIQSVADDVAAVVPSSDPGGVDVALAHGAIQLREVLSGALGASSRALMSVVLGVGLLLVALTVTGAVNTRRRDFGRARALGATRHTIVVLVLIQTALSASMGVCAGFIIAVPATQISSGGLPGPGFLAGVAVLAILMAMLGALVPAMAAAGRDPVRILRVP